MRFSRLIWLALIAAVLGGAVGLWITRPNRVDPANYAGLTGVPSKGELVYHAAGCHSCHGSETDKDQLALVGGQAFPSDFGTFYAPNISSDPLHGIGAWSLMDFANALQAGVSPEGKHYYPAFPYTNYARMTPQDVVDLWSYILLMPASPTPSKAHDVGFPFNIRRGLGVWKHCIWTKVGLSKILGPNAGAIWSKRSPIAENATPRETPSAASTGPNGWKARPTHRVEEIFPRLLLANLVGTKWTSPTICSKASRQISTASVAIWCPWWKTWRGCRKATDTPSQHICQPCPSFSIRAWRNFAKSSPAW